MAAHGHQAGLLLQGDNLLAIGQHVAQRDLDLHVLARFQAGDGLPGVHLRGRAQDHGIHFLDGQAVLQLGGDMLDAVLVGHFLGLGQVAADEGDDFDAVDVFNTVQVLDAEGASACECDFDGHGCVL
ncbi:hypothetical protein D3C72_2106200 [compost metagenome]